ncbi:LppA family lipoprotein [Mycobacterium gastri]|uniref:Lipoprotein LppV n=1 Tax=Mycobacterium gastri TaxID=1777 RepID=A0A1X1V2P0_MYCGS|nr:LppA family lipoprotein [Mycobacterium gastri]ETW25718.1 hypothetical protein MGAST_01020 [Mycobacterium gastri 'Wayne']ORV63322.1 hypothetical protein AWC07_16485 [Mycobacterium gastri]
MRWPIAWLLAVVCVVVLGCGRISHGTGSGAEGPLSPERVAELENPLRAKPSLEAAKEQYLAAVTQMASAIAALALGLTWRTDMDTWTGCGGDYEWTRAKAAYFMIVFSGPIADDKWPQAVQIVKDGAKQFGATNFGTMKNKPGDHDVYIAGHGGVEFKLSTQKAAVLTAQSDCRISETDTPKPTLTP